MISLCMIVKDEKDNLERCLKSAEGIADEIIIVDTGSTDSTVEIAKKYTNKVYFYRWINDFSAARNFSLSKANGDWILILDGDDEVPSKHKEDIRELTKDTSVDVYSFNTLNFTNENDTQNLIYNLNPRLFQNKFGYKYEGAVHNQLLSVIKRVNPNFVMKIAAIDIFHYGYLQTNVIKKHKRERNMSILHSQLEENPKDTFALFNMGNEYYALNNSKEAFDYYLKAHKTTEPGMGFYPKLIIRMLLCCKELKLYDDIYKFAAKALNYYPKFTDLYYVRGFINYFLGKPTAAVSDLEKALELGDPLPNLAYFKGAGTYKSVELLCKIHFDYEDYENCLKYCIELFKYPYVSNFETIKMLVYSLYKLYAPKEEIQKAIKIVLNNSEEKGFIFASNLLIAVKDFNLALEYINKGFEDLASKDLDENLKKDLMNNLQYYKGICEFSLKDYKKSIQTLMNINKQKFTDASTPYLLLSGLFTENENIVKFAISNDKCKGKVYKALNDILNGHKPEILAEDEKESLKYEGIIYSILENLLDVEKNNEFEKALSLLDLIKSSDSLLRLGKLYYKYGKYELCKKELFSSISLKNVTDKSTLRVLSNLWPEES
ncbi:glycosyltransferase family 2 protein [Oceanirhabdus seepicola]|uniref:Glycosyltransferase family 2 protein n=1 Tax=Oceanirhabdus seepicola TaxID=2828781 RepID=A0A9J6P1H5_9CLOT|nr:glycosyltransferase family 2 protein [Oceanirhabdus seepicola]MCM1989320.1 glycosyltransferase family 2 protein [Oceanirhabdus seepicola]